MHEVVQVRSAAEMHEAVMARAAARGRRGHGGGGRRLHRARAGRSEDHEERRPAGAHADADTDILGDLGKLPSRQSERRPLLVGFAAETHDVLAHARGKLERKAVDLIVANDVTKPGAGFDTATNAVTLVSMDGAEQVPLQSKTAVAGRILDRVERFLPAARPRTSDNRCRRICIEHLRFFQALGVRGVSRDAAWRQTSVAAGRPECRVPDGAVRPGRRP